MKSLFFSIFFDKNVAVLPHDLLLWLVYRKKQRLAAVNLLLTSELRKNDESFDLLFDKVNVNLEKLNYTNV